MTKIGLTDTIVIEDGIRERRLLSGPEFGLLIDELNIELRTAYLGVQYGFIIIIRLLFMDDIALLARSAIHIPRWAFNKKCHTSLSSKGKVMPG